MRRDWSAWQVVWMFVVTLAEVAVSQGGEGSNCKHEAGEGREDASQGSADGRSMVWHISDGQTRSMMLRPKKRYS